MLAWAKIEGIGFSAFISMGNEADISLPEIRGYLVEDNSTKVIAMYMESVRAGSSLVESVQFATKNKPVVAMKVGTTATGATTAASHTSAMAVEDALLDGLFKQFSVIRAKDPDELFHLATSFTELPLPHGRSAAVVATGGGWAVECADLSEIRGLKLTPLPYDVLKVADSLLQSYWSRKNPIDMVATPAPIITTFNSTFCNLIMSYPLLSTNVSYIENTTVHGVFIGNYNVTFNSHEPNSNMIVIHAVVLKPNGTGMPAMLLLHGAGGTLEQMLPYGLEFASRGYVVMAMDSPECGLSTGPTSNSTNTINFSDGPYSAYCYHNTIAATRALTVLSSLPYVNSSAIGVSGASMGGITTFWVAAIDSGLKLRYLLWQVATLTI